jgi:WXG100 family type VII secretion target
MAEQIQVKYEELDQLISQIHTHAEQISAVFKKVQSQTATLARSWRGQGVDQFQREMEDLVLPALKRLSVSLEVAEDTLGRIKEVFLEAEEEAVACFPDDSEEAENAYIEWAHRVLMGAGFIEWAGIGIAAGAIDTALYAYEGRWREAGWSLVATIPFGDYIKAAKMGGKAGKELLEAGLKKGANAADSPVWKYYGTTRGNTIEHYMAKLCRRGGEIRRLPKNFKTIDFVSGGTTRVIKDANGKWAGEVIEGAVGISEKTLDLGGTSVKSADELFRSQKRHIDALIDFKPYKGKGIEVKDLSEKVLNLRYGPGKPSQAQIEGLERLIKYAQDNDITINISRF